MSAEKIDQSRVEQDTGRLAGDETPEAPCCCAGLGSCDAGDGQTAPCCDGSMLKRHRLAVCAVVSVLALAFLVSQVGGILGVIAFFRTL